ncbi:hypothetical protein SKAU_G00147930 [Synaphobranchus kaupii]|uniref:Uncharacterized protein n=1 Tax=Synaphobranchus kaupii TaxID=118154 RepID=A0A9Q1FTM4_SYNKA|nr:hypothetical protein SKAU_G00147930 [Synaphobranchus kaupii]
MSAIDSDKDGNFGGRVIGREGIEEFYPRMWKNESRSPSKSDGGSPAHVKSESRSPSPQPIPSLQALSVPFQIPLQVPPDFPSGGGAAVVEDAAAEPRQLRRDWLRPPPIPGVMAYNSVLYPEPAALWELRSLTPLHRVAAAARYYKCTLGLQALKPPRSGAF